MAELVQEGPVYGHALTHSYLVLSAKIKSRKIIFTVFNLQDGKRELISKKKGEKEFKSTAD